MSEPWYMVTPFSKQPDHLSRKDYLKLRRFYTQQLALSQALLAAKLPGICRTTTSVGEVSLDMFQEVEGGQSSIISNVDSKEMST